MGVNCRTVLDSLTLKIPKALNGRLTDTCKKHLILLPDTAKVGFLKVPFKPDSISSYIYIHYYYFGDIKNRERKNVLFFNGGPVASSHNLYTSLLEKEDHYKVNFIFMDQRGTGCSTTTDIESQNWKRQFSTFWNSDDIVRDSEALRKILLKDQQWSIMGQSYGALIGARYVELHPESLKSAHLLGILWV